MESSEELMLLLELNGFDVKKFKLKKQLEYEETGNLDLYKQKKFADLLLCHYSFKEDSELFHRNPLTYQESWGVDGISLDQFYISHPDLDKSITLKQFLELKNFNEINRESILFDVLDTWVEEYRQATITQMENLREMMKLLPKKSRKYKKPSKLTFILSILLAVNLMFLFKSPETLKPTFLSFLSFWTILVDNFVELLYEVPWYSFLGNVAIFLMIVYAVLNNFISRYIKDVRSEKNKRAEQVFDKWEQNMKDSRLKQAGILEDYVDLVTKHPQNSELELKSLIGPNILLKKFKTYVLMIERRFDWMTKYYRTIFRVLRIEHLVAILTYIAFFLIGFAKIRGWI